MMTKLYQKSEILFAIFWIVLYTVIMANVPNVEDGPYAMIALIAICLLMLLRLLMKDVLTDIVENQF